MMLTLIFYFYRSYRMMRLCNMGSGKMWHMSIVISLLLLPAISLAQSLNAPPPSTTLTTSAHPTASLPRVDWADAQEIYPLIRKWVDQGKVQTNPAHPAVRLVGGFGGMRVTLRWMGVTYGLGDSLIEPSRQTPDRRSDLLHHARNSTAAALRMVRAKLPQWAAMPPRQRPRLLIDLQIALAAREIPLPQKKITLNPLKLMCPGYHGLILQTPSPNTSQTASTLTWNWPATSLARNLSPTSVFRRLMMTPGSQPNFKNPLTRLTPPLKLYRFSIIHLVQPAPDQPVTRLIRGQILLPPLLDSPSLDELTQRMATHLARCQRENGSMSGTYHPSSGRYNPQNAPLRDQALAAYAMTRWLKHANPSPKGHPNIHSNQSPTRFKVQQAIKRATSYLTRQLNTSHAISRFPVAAAWTLRTLLENPELTHDKINRDRLALALVKCQQANGAFAHPPQPASPTRSTTTSRTSTPRPLRTSPVAMRLTNQTILILALGAYFDQTRQPDTRAVLTRWLTWSNGLHQAIPVQTMASLLQIRQLSHRLNLKIALQKADDEQVTAWMRQLLLMHQITEPSEQGPADVIGGIDLHPIQSTLGPNPDWRTAYALSCLATLIRQRPLLQTISQKLGLSKSEILVRAAMAARFLGQLTFTEPACYYGISRRDMLGGVRLALWENRITPRASAMALLACVQLRDALSPPKKQATKTTP